MDQDEMFFSPTYRIGGLLMASGYTVEDETVTRPGA
jgi:hypothetical protein